MCVFSYKDIHNFSLPRERVYPQARSLDRLLAEELIRYVPRLWIESQCPSIDETFSLFRFLPREEAMIDNIWNLLKGASNIRFVEVNKVWKIVAASSHGHAPNSLPEQGSEDLHLHIQPNTY